LVQETPAWNYVKQYDAAQDGRAAFLALQTRGEGDAAEDARRAKAEQIIAKAQFTGKSKRFTMSHYINLLQGAFTELASIGEGEYALTEKQKVSIFMRGLVAEEYAATKHSIYQNPLTRDDFQQCYAFVQTMEQFKANYTDTNSYDRNIAEASSNKKDHTGYLSSQDWAKLSKEERSKIISNRKKGGKKGKKADKGAKRKLEAVVTGTVEALSALTGDETATPTVTTEGTGNSASMSSGSNSPGDQFGRRTNEIRRLIDQVVSVAKGKQSSE
jgi:hypothetical protein